jgi:hypothetical protein
MLDKIKKALRIKTDAYNDELTELMKAGLIDLGFGGAMNEVLTEDADPIVTQAVITYCKMNFGLPEDYDRLKRSYDEQKAQLGTATGYTRWANV